MNPRDVVRDELGLSRGVSRRRVLQAVGGTVAIGAASSGASAQQGGPAEFDQIDTASSDATSWDFQDLTGDIVGRSSPIDNVDVGYYVGETPPSTGDYLVFDDPAGSNNANLTAVKRYSGGGWVTCENARYYQDGSVTHEFDDADIKTWQVDEWVPIPDAVSAIPDSEADQKLLHRWGLNDINGTVEDSVGSADGTVNGVTSVSGDWAGGSAGQGDGNGDYIETTTWGSFGSSLDTDFAIAISIQTTDTSGNAAILGNASFPGAMELFVADGRWGVPDNNTAAFVIRDGNDNDNSVYGTTAITDGNPYRVVINKSTNSASGWEVYVNQTEETAVGRDEGTSSVSDFDSPTNLFARTEPDGADSFYVEAILDDICIFGDSLTQEEAQSYANPWDA